MGTSPLAALLFSLAGVLPAVIVGHVGEYARIRSAAVKDDDLRFFAQLATWSALLIVWLLALGWAYLMLAHLAVVLDDTRVYLVHVAGSCAAAALIGSFLAYGRMRLKQTHDDLHRAFDRAAPRTRTTVSHGPDERVY